MVDSAERPAVGQGNAPVTRLYFWTKNWDSLSSTKLQEYSLLLLLTRGGAPVEGERDAYIIWPPFQSRQALLNHGWHHLHGTLTFGKL